MWLDEESGREEKYKGRITKVARGGQSLTMKYDIPGDDDPAYNMKTIEIIADIVLGILYSKILKQVIFVLQALYTLTWFSA